MAARPAFPNYTQLPRIVPPSAWRALRVVSVLAALALCVLLVVQPTTGLFLWWGLAVPLLPLVFFAAPGLWRNICPMAALNQTPRVLGFSLGLTLPPWAKQYAYVGGIALFFVVVPARKVIFNDNGPALALLLLAVLALAFVGGLVFKGKSGWCSSGVCPLFPVQRVYGQTPFAVIPNSHCATCVGCARNCYDFSPTAAYLSDMYDEDRQWSAHRKFFAAAFPGFIVAFYTVPNPPAIGVAEMYLRFAAIVLASVGVVTALDAFARATPAQLTAVCAVAALNLYYWYNVPLFLNRVGLGAAPAVVWAARAALLAVTALWLARTFRKERLYLDQMATSRPGAALPVRAARPAAGSDGAQVTIVPENRQAAAQPGRSLLEVIESSGLRIESGCRMGVCGADPIAIVEGMDNLDPVSDDERNTLERLGLASNTRMACVCRVRGPVTLSLKPERPAAFSSSVVRGFRADPSVQRVVIVGNGIAGVTAADHVRRRNPACEIHVVAREKHHLYNRMGIERLVYGRSAMQGLYLQDEAWYNDLNITVWLNTRAVRIDRQAREVELAMGERLPYDRLILATGSRSFVPPIDGFWTPGTFVMREADDALAIRAYAQEHRCATAVVAGGGLLGLEAAHALHRLGLRVAVLERSDGLLRRQLDARGAQFLQAHLESIGLQIVTGAETAAVLGDGRCQAVRLKDGRTLPCDMLLVAAGINANVELAKEAGLETDRGVVVDDHLRTSDPLIYAAGDVAQHRGTVAGLWPVAAEQAQVVAVNALGGERRYEPTPPVTMLKVVGVDLTSIGRIEAKSADEFVIALEEPEERRYRKLIVDRGELVGAILIGYPVLAPVVSSAIRRHVHVTPLLEDLRAGDWDGLGGLPDGVGQEFQAPSAKSQVREAPVAVPATPAAARETPHAAVGTAPPPVAAEASAVRRSIFGRSRAAPHLLLRVRAGPADGTVFEVDPAGAGFGRAPDNDLVIADQGLSRRHARIDFTDGGYWISDLGSTNGVAVNGARVREPRRLASGDIIAAGATRMAVEVLGG